MKNKPRKEERSLSVFVNPNYRRMKRRRPPLFWALALAVSLPSHEAWMPSQPQRFCERDSRTLSVCAKKSRTDEKLPEESEGWSFSKFFIASEKKDAVIEQPEEKGFSFGGMFRRKNKDDQKDDTKSKKKDDTKPKSKDDTKSKKKRSEEKSPQKVKKQEKQEEEDKGEKKDFNPITAAQNFVVNTFTSSKIKWAEEWVPVFPKTRLAPGEIVPATVAGIDLLVIASKDGRKLYCITNSCPHLGTFLKRKLEDNYLSSSI
jgi:outer membrane biosynthesis protein TonB